MGVRMRMGRGRLGLEQSFSWCISIWHSCFNAATIIPSSWGSSPAFEGLKGNFNFKAPVLQGWWARCCRDPAAPWNLPINKPQFHSHGEIQNVTLMLCTMEVLCMGHRNIFLQAAWVRILFKVKNQILLHFRHCCIISCMTNFFFPSQKKLALTS